MSFPAWERNIYVKWRLSMKNKMFLILNNKMRTKLLHSCFFGFIIHTLAIGGWISWCENAPGWGQEVYHQNISLMWSCAQWDNSKGEPWAAPALCPLFAAPCCAKSCLNRCSPGACPPDIRAPCCLCECLQPFKGGNIHYIPYQQHIGSCSPIPQLHVHGVSYALTPLLSFPVSMMEYSLDGHNVSLSAIRTVRVLRPLRAINRVPSK